MDDRVRAGRGPDLHRHHAPKLWRRGQQLCDASQRSQHATNNVAKRPLEFFIRLAREQLRPTYGQGFRGAPLQPDTEELHPQPIRAGGSRAKVIQSTSEVSRSEEEV